MPPRPRRQKQSRDEADEDGLVPIGEGSVMKEMIVRAPRARRPRTDAAEPSADGQSRATAAAAAAAAAEWEDTSGSSDGSDGSDGSDVDERFEDMDDGEVVVDSDDDGSDDDCGGDDDDAEYDGLRAEAAAARGRRVQFASGGQSTAGVGAAAAGDDGGDDGDDVGKVWRSDRGEGLGGGQALAYSNRAYDCFFQLRSEFPCLSFDIVRDALGSGRTKYPMAMSFVCGSQAPEAVQNQLYAIKVSNVVRTRHDVEDEEASDDDMFGADDSEDDASDGDGAEEEVNNGEPLVAHQTVKHHGTVNRLRLDPAAPYICAAWSDTGVVQVFDLEAEVRSLCDFEAWSTEQAAAAVAAAGGGGGGRSRRPALRFASSGREHGVEGYALAWAAAGHSAHQFVSGDCAGRVAAWQPAEGRWAAAAVSPASAGRSVEELQWSPVQPGVLLATRAGGDVEVWDTRDMTRPKLRWRADPTDVNVASWNTARMSSHLVATGADSGVIAVWDLRAVQGVGSSAVTADPLQRLPFHQGAAITSLEFSEHNECVLAATSGDGQCTLWDLSLERDPLEEREVMGELFNRDDTRGLPDQLMFQHQGLRDPKEAHFHPQIPGLVVTTDFEGLHLFKPRNWRSLMK